MTRTNAAHGAPTPPAAAPPGASAAPPAAEARRARDAATQFEALLLAQAFAPLAKAIGFYGDAVVASAARAMASAEHGGLADRLASLVAASSAAGAGAAPVPAPHPTSEESRP